MTNRIYIKFSECGQHIRKWSREPFDGGELYRAQHEYICECGQRVEPHRCRDTMGEW